MANTAPNPSAASSSASAAPVATDAHNTLHLATPANLPDVTTSVSTLGGVLQDFIAVVQHENPDMLPTIWARHGTATAAILCAYAAAVADLLSHADFSVLHSRTVPQIGFLLASLSEAAECVGESENRAL